MHVYERLEKLTDKGNIRNFYEKLRRLTERCKTEADSYSAQRGYRVTDSQHILN